MQKKSFIAKDVLGVLFFLLAVVVGAFLINSFVFRSFSVTGPSMEPTLYTGDRLIVNRVPSAWAKITGKSWVPSRGEVIVFENPGFISGSAERYLVKRVIGLPGERVEVKDGRITVYNPQHPAGFNPDLEFQGPGSPTSGETNVEVPADHIFVSGDHRAGGFSFDSRNGLGNVPLENIQGPVGIRIFPLDGIRFF